jgi:nucleotide-binding universal stress UspA family protein
VSGASDRPAPRHPVIAGYDGSPAARNALAYAAGMARRSGRPLLVVHVLPPAVRSDPLTGVAVALPSDLEAMERWLLAELDQVADTADLSVHVRARRGNRAGELAATAAELGADALVIGAPTRCWHYFAGAAAGRLARHSRCTVIVVP